MTTMLISRSLFRAAPALALTALLAAGCRPDAPGAEPQRTAAQHEAARRACVAAEMIALSEDEIETLQATLGDGADTGPAIPRQAQRAALQFAQVVHQYALLRHSALAHVDSALNHAARSADSARHVAAAERFVPRPAELGTVEANARAEYERRFTRVLEDADHRCNWDV
jgi:hypothetical protein